SILASHCCISTVEKFFEETVMICRTFDRPILLILDFQSLAGFHYLPCRLAYDCDIVIESHHVDDARHCLSCSDVDRFDFHTERRRSLDQGDQPSFAVEVQTIERFARNHLMVVDVSSGRSYEFEVLYVLQFNVGRNWYRSRCRCEF